MVTNKQQTDFLIAHIVDEMTHYLLEDFEVDVVHALNVIYNSEVYELLQDKQNELYIQSPAYIYELLKKEYLTASILP